MSILAGKNQRVTQLAVLAVECLALQNQKFVDAVRQRVLQKHPKATPITFRHQFQQHLYAYLQTPPDDGLGFDPMQRNRHDLWNHFLIKYFQKNNEDKDVNAQEQALADAVQQALTTPNRDLEKKLTAEELQLFENFIKERLLQPLLDHSDHIEREGTHSVNSPLHDAPYFKPVIPEDTLKSGSKPHREYVNLVRYWQSHYFPSLASRVGFVLLMIIMTAMAFMGLGMLANLGVLGMVGSFLVWSKVVWLSGIVAQQFAMGTVGVLGWSVITGVGAWFATFSLRSLLEPGVWRQIWGIGAISSIAFPGFFHSPEDQSLHNLRNFTKDSLRARVRLRLGESLLNPYLLATRVLALPFNLLEWIGAKFEVWLSSQQTYAGNDLVQASLKPARWSYQLWTGLYNFVYEIAATPLVLLKPVTWLMQAGIHLITYLLPDRVVSYHQANQRLWNQLTARKNQRNVIVDGTCKSMFMGRHFETRNLDGDSQKEQKKIWDERKKFLEKLQNFVGRLDRHYCALCADQVNLSSNLLDENAKERQVYHHQLVRLNIAYHKWQCCGKMLTLHYLGETKDISDLTAQERESMNTVLEKMAAKFQQVETLFKEVEELIKHIQSVQPEKQINFQRIELLEKDTSAYGNNPITHKQSSVCLPLPPPGSSTEMQPMDKHFTNAKDSPQ